jgi:hypothetical protein
VRYSIIEKGENEMKDYWICKIPFHAKMTITARRTIREGYASALEDAGYNETSWRYATETAAKMKQSEIAGATGLVMEVTRGMTL